MGADALAEGDWDSLPEGGPGAEGVTLAAEGTGGAEGSDGAGEVGAAVPALVAARDPLALDGPPPAGVQPMISTARMLRA